MARPKPSKRAIAGILPFIFALLAFTFSLLSVTSPEWASRNHYPDNTDAISQTTPIYTRYRSPFQICTAEPVDEPASTTSNSTTTSTNSTTSDDDDEPDNQPPPQPTSFVTTCTHYHLYGLNKTSCELPSTIGSNLALNHGDARQCQQIHLSGNYLVASAVFLGVSMLATLILFLVNLSDSIKYRAKSVENGNEASHLSHVHHFPKILTILPTILSPLIFVGVVTALVSQFYAIEGLIQSAKNNGDFTTSLGNREPHDPWVQGTALSTYLSLSWFWALLAGWSSCLLWGGSARRNVAAVLAHPGMGEREGHEAHGVKVK